MSLEPTPSSGSGAAPRARFPRNVTAPLTSFKGLVPGVSFPVRVETVCAGGEGGFAQALIQVRNVFPGPGGLVITAQDMVVAYRIPLSLGYSPLRESLPGELHYESLAARTALDTYLRHAILKKLDDFHFRRGRYHFPHIPRPLGCTDEGGYLYEWTHGVDGFPSRYYDDELRKLPVDLGEENMAANCFAAAGVKLLHDTAEPEGDGRKNLIIQEPHLPAPVEKISNLWKRIDFGEESLPIDYSRLVEYLATMRDELNFHLGADRVEMMELAADYLLTRATPRTFARFGRLSELLLNYRQNTAAHMGLETIGPPRPSRMAQLTPIVVSEEAEPQAPKVIRQIRTSDSSTLHLEVRRSFPCFDGTLHLQQDVLVATLTRPHEELPDAGFRLFLRHFLIRKLENAFIAQQRYTAGHIPRPLGSEGRSYFYEWEYGEANCPRILLDTPSTRRNYSGLDDWHEFLHSFRECGVEMGAGLRFVRRGDSPQEFAKQIIVRQPMSGFDGQYISRMWMRVNFHERSTPIDYARLEQYLVANEEDLTREVTAERYLTMRLAVAFLRGTLPQERLALLRDGIHAFRVSALRHLTFRGFESPQALEPP